MKKLLSLLLTLFMGMSAWAGTIVFADLGLENGVQYLDPFDGGDFTVTFAGGANDGKYYTTGAGIRVYGDGTMTVAAKEGSITEITVTYANGNSYCPTSADVVNVGTYDPETGVWTGSASSVVFTRPSGSGHWRVQKVEVTLNGETPPVLETVKTPIFNPDGGEITEAINVEISCETEGALIYYSFDQTNWIEYENPIEISETTTLYAKATKENMNDSQVASTTFTLVDPTVSYAMFDFDNDYVTLFPTITGTSSQSSSDGDILEDVTATVNRILLTVTPNPSGTPNRIWSGSPRLRMYGGQMTITAPEGYVITNLEISQGKWNDGNSANLGTLTNVSWEGNASTLVITIAGNTQFKYINVIYKPGQGDEPPTPQIEEISTIAEYKTLNENSEFIFNGNVVCVQDYSVTNNSSTHRYLYVADETGGMIIYDPDADSPQYETCNIIPGGWKGKKTFYRNLPEATSVTNLEESVANTNISPIEVTIDGIDATMYGDWVIIKNVLIREASSKDGIQEGSYVITDGVNELDIYALHTQDFELPEDWESDTRYDVIGILGVYGTTNQIMPTGIEKNGETITAISNINTEIKSIKYYDLTGRSSSTPFDGVNIISTEYTNGTKKINKTIKR